jgi:cytochrome c oxidase accessory protein FixG
MTVPTAAPPSSQERPNASALPPRAGERVLSTLNVDGTRRWLRPRASQGRFWRRRFVVAWLLIGFFVAVPHLRVGGQPLMLLDVAQRQFTLVGRTFLATDFALLMLLMLGIFVAIFLATALIGRAWCGWACPQTVYMEYVFRPLERLIEGPVSEQARMDREGWEARRWIKQGVYLVIATFLAHTFLAYFVGWDALMQWVQRSPFEHPGSFLVMAGTTALVFLDFAYFREQTCVLACPYGRFQSVLLDRDSLIVGYDARRGEPRGKLVKGRTPPGQGDRGDCIDCRACVATCPTGIDIREGLQMECVGCTQCVDACDAIMDRIGKPRGLIRYTSQSALAGERRRLLRPRVVLYPVVLLLAFGLLGARLAARETADVTVLRGGGSPFTELPGDRVANQIRVKVVNRSDRPQRYGVALVDVPEATVVAPELPLPVEPGRSKTTTLFVTLPRSALPAGERRVAFRVTDGDALDTTREYVLLGPRDAAAAAGAQR